MAITTSNSRRSWPTSPHSAGPPTSTTRSWASATPPPTATSWASPVQPRPATGARPAAQYERIFRFPGCLGQAHG